MPHRPDKSGWRRLLIFGVLIGIHAVGEPSCVAALRFTGVNLAGAEFGVVGGALPGNYNQHYIYPNATEINYYVGKGMNTFRLPIRWERLQQSQNADFNATELGRLNTFVNTATAAGSYVIIEPHNFARYYPNTSSFNQMQSGTTGRIGGTTVPVSALADFWSRMADQYMNSDRVIFNLMNEPNAIQQSTWVDAINQSIAAIRATGAKNLILVPGNRWTGAWTWNDSDFLGESNADAMLDIVDPINNFAFDVHQYLDSNGSGGSDEIANDNTNIGVQRLTNFTNWLHANDFRGFLGEFAVANSRIGAGATQIGDETLHNMLDFIDANDDVWLGWAWWGGGPWWGDYLFALDPTNLSNPVDRPAMTVLVDHLAAYLPGDHNHDGEVDAADYVVWRRSQGQTGAVLDADSNIDGVIDELDYSAWRSNFGATAGGGALAQTTVPEPAAIALAVAGCLAAGTTARRRVPRRCRT